MYYNQFPHFLGRCWTPAKASELGGPHGCHSLGGRLLLKLTGREDVKDACSEHLLCKCTRVPVQPQPTQSTAALCSPALKQLLATSRSLLGSALSFLSLLFLIPSKIWGRGEYFLFFFRHQFPKCQEIKATRGCFRHTKTALTALLPGFALQPSCNSFLTVFKLSHPPVQGPGIADWCHRT